MADPQINDDLLTELSKIAEVVQKFPEGTQLLVTERLLNSLLPARRQHHSSEPEASAKAAEEAPQQKETGADKEAKKRRGKGKARSAADWRDPSLDLNPAGKESFSAFAGSRRTANQNEKIAVAVYYLGEILGLNPIGGKQIFQCFDECNWNLPSDPANALSQAKSKSAVITFDNFEEIALTPKWRNAVRNNTADPTS